VRGRCSFSFLSGCAHRALDPGFSDRCFCPPRQRFTNVCVKFLLCRERPLKRPCSSGKYFFSQAAFRQGCSFGFLMKSTSGRRVFQSAVKPQL